MEPADLNHIVVMYLKILNGPVCKSIQTLVPLSLLPFFRQQLNFCILFQHLPLWWSIGLLGVWLNSFSSFSISAWPCSLLISMDFWSLWVLPFFGCFSSQRHSITNQQTQQQNVSVRKSGWKSDTLMLSVSDSPCLGTMRTADYWSW